MRPIEPEAVFGDIKFNHGFKRFRLKSNAAQYCGRQLPLRGVSTPGHGQGEGPIGSKLSRSDDEDDDGRGRSERSERSPLRGNLPPL